MKNVTFRLKNGKRILSNSIFHNLFHLHSKSIKTSTFDWFKGIVVKDIGKAIQYKLHKCEPFQCDKSSFSLDYLDCGPYRA